MTRAKDQRTYVSNRQQDARILTHLLYSTDIFTARLARWCWMARRGRMAPTDGQTDMEHTGAVPEARR